jgi:hypothetical protein
MEDPNWNVPPGEQLTLDLPVITGSVGVEAHDAFATEREAANLLRKLARALGEHRAAMDLEEYQRGLVLENIV